MPKIKPIRFAHGRPMLLGGLRCYHLYTESSRSIPEQWEAFRALGRIPGQTGSAFYGVMCGHDAGGIEYLCGVEVDSFAGLPSELGRMRILEEEYAVFGHSGQISTIRTTWERILHEWFPNGGYRSANKPDFEVYDQRFDTRTGSGDVEIWIAISNAGAPDA
ncbi:GyrI-like domain-containing protein [Chlorobium ferrooxidans]|uniref:Transcription activator, effector binding n=1 Tax=Chlorobium ferrooxidans DSM 13031 TaxID=377431 RepID=Q0YQP0_9CHLB|nr:GyrI-like domain-containing protein [Chlorobium ferrooxidans]EAT58581.1 transcription activator, effector binding [Chlorobium ferrooxidans DSM 13031]